LAPSSILHSSIEAAFTFHKIKECFISADDRARRLNETRGYTWLYVTRSSGNWTEDDGQQRAVTKRACCPSNPEYIFHAGALRYVFMSRPICPTRFALRADMQQQLQASDAAAINDSAARTKHSRRAEPPRGKRETGNGVNQCQVDAKSIQRVKL